jgi:hypothetical protein
MVQHLDGAHPFIGTHVEEDHHILLLFGLSGGAILLVMEFIVLHMDSCHGGDYF